MRLIQENAFENVVWDMAAILSRSQCVYPVGTFFTHMVPTWPYVPHFTGHVITYAC